MTSYREKVADDRLARRVECAWGIAAGDPVWEYAVVPDGCVDVVYLPGTGLRVVGTMTVEQHFSLPSGSQVAGVRFRPGMAGQILGIAPAELTDRSVALDALWGAAAREIEERIATTSSVDDPLDFLLGCIAPGPPPNPVQRAIEFISAADGCADLDFIARQANLSPRQFRRRCMEESGLTPKQLCRVLRFRHAGRLAQNATQPNWSRIANDAGYFDQAHLIRDFREFTGRTPVSVFSNTLAAR